METIDNLKKRATGIRQATLEAEITPERLGSLLVDMIELLGKATPPGEGKTVNISIAYHLADGSWGSTAPEGTVEVPVGGSLKVRMLPVAGHEVERFNVDQVEQPLATEYTFTDVQTDHTMYVWFKVSDTPEEIPVDFLERSDLPGTRYSTLHSAMSAVKTAYPGGLPRDVTIKCVKEATEKRQSNDPDKLVGDRIWTAVLSSWNKDSRYSLIVDGDNKYTLSGYSLGGVFLKEVDNVLFKNMHFRDYCNFAKGGTPEEIAAIYSLGSLDNKNKNIAVINCYFNGSYTSAPGVSYPYYAIDTKLTSNVIVDNCTFEKAGARVFKVTDVDVLEIKRSKVAGQHVYAIAHPNLVFCSGAKKLLISDCEFDGDTMKEYAMQITNVDRLSVQRTRFTNVQGQPFTITGPGKIEVNFDSCLFENCLKAPQFQYCRFIARFEQPVKKLSVRNNTFYMNGEGVYFQQVFSVNGDVDELVNYNNIYIDKVGKLNAIMAVVGTIGTYKSGNNLYKAVLHSSGSRFNATSILDNAMITFDKRSLKSFQDSGFEKDSSALADSVNILDTEIGNPGFALLSSLNLTYPSDINNVPAHDLSYKLMDYKPTAGAYNLNGDTWDETADTSEGYAGLHVEENKNFSDGVVYTLPSDDNVLMEVHCEDRTKFIKTVIYSTGKAITRYGKHVYFTLDCEVDETGAHVNDVNYSIEIEKL